MCTSTRHGRRILRAAITTLGAGTAIVLAPAAASADVTAADVRVTESDGQSQVTFSLVRQVGLGVLPTTVEVATVNGSATAPGDYLAKQTAVSFPLGIAGEVQRRDVTVTLVGDALHEPTEIFGIALNGSEVTDSLAVATVLDDDPPPAPAAPAPPTPAPAPVTPPRFGLGAPRLQRPSLVRVALACPTQLGTCKGTLTVRSRAETKARLKSLRKARTLGRRSFTLRAGQTTTLRLRLKAADLKLLRAARRMRVQATVVVTDRAGRRTTRRASGTLVARLSFTD